MLVDKEETLTQTHLVALTLNNLRVAERKTKLSGYCGWLSLLTGCGEVQATAGAGGPLFRRSNSLTTIPKIGAKASGLPSGVRFNLSRVQRKPQI